MLVSYRSLIRHVSLQWSMSRSLIGLQSGKLVSDEACWGLQWVSDLACWSQMKHVDVSDGLQSDMSVSDGSTIGLRWVSDNNNIMVNLTLKKKLFQLNFFFIRFVFWLQLINDVFVASTTILYQPLLYRVTYRGNYLVRTNRDCYFLFL